MFKCPICGKFMGALKKSHAIDGDICLHCSLICSSYATEKIDTLIKFWQINDDRLSEFKKSQVLSEFGTNTITMDYKNKFFILGNLNQKRPIVYAFNEIDYYEYEDIPIGIFETKKSGI